MRRRQFLGALDGVTDPETKRKTIGRVFIEVFDARGRQDRGRRLPGPGHALSRRDRERLGPRRPVGGDQEPPQRRRPAGLHEAEAGRAAARAVQGRGARAGRRARPAAGLRRPPPVPGPGPGHPHPRRGHAARRSPSCSRPTPSTSTRSARPASTTRSGRPSPCCCRCRPSASWATPAPTTTSCALRAVTSTDGMTADFFEFPWDVLARAATRIINEVTRRQPRRLRRDLQAARHDRVGVSGALGDERLRGGSIAPARGRR